jgi:hypothetical protein
MPLAHESHLNAWAEPFPGANYLRQTLAVAEADVRKLIHDPVELFTRMVQPILWLLIFGQVFNRTRAAESATWISWRPEFWRKACCSARFFTAFR